MSEKIELFSRDPTEENIWDDTALILAYDRAVSLAKKEVEKRLNNSTKLESSVETKQKVNHSNPKKVSGSNEKIYWKIGMSCKAIYHEDNQLYEAVITQISPENGLGLIRFLGYNNEQWTYTDDLMRSDGREAQKKQMEMARNKDAWEEKTTPNPSISNPKNMSGPHSKATSTSLPKSGFDISTPFGGMMPPPPPIQLAGVLSSEESEAMSTMLMSWYLNGFHTGYYMGLKKGKEASNLNHQ